MDTIRDPDDPLRRPAASHASTGIDPNATTGIDPKVEWYTHGAPPADAATYSEGLTEQQDHAGAWRTTSYSSTTADAGIDAATDNSLDKLASAILGAAEGLERGLDDSGIEHHAANAIGEADRFGRVARYKSTTVQAQMASPGPQGRPVEAIHFTDHPSGAAERTTAAVRRQGRRLRHLAHKTRVRADAVRETGRRARVAPATIANDLRLAGKSAVQGVTKSITGYAIAGALGAAAFVVFTVFAVQGLDLWLGAPWGALIVALVYGAIAAVFVARAKAAQAKAKARTRHLLAHARNEASGVVEPMREAFRKDAAGDAMVDEAATWETATAHRFTAAANDRVEKGTREM